jgi:hypothetical protein
MFALAVVSIMLVVASVHEAWAIWRHETAWRRAVKRRGKLVDQIAQRSSRAPLEASGFDSKAH